MGANELAIRVAELRLRVGDLVRRMDANEDRLGDVEKELDSVTRAQEIAREVAKELSKPRHRGLPVALSLWQKIAGIIAGGIILTDFVRGFFS